MQKNSELIPEINNPCKECLVKVICTYNCKELNSCIDNFLESFERSTSIGIAAECWITKIEVRPRVLQLWKEHGYR